MMRARLKRGNLIQKEMPSPHSIMDRMCFMSNAASQS
jgi:hypothetical protein